MARKRRLAGRGSNSRARTIVTLLHKVATVLTLDVHTHFPRFRNFNFDFISENVGLVNGSLSQHICIKRITPLLSQISLGKSGLNAGISRFLTCSMMSGKTKMMSYYTDKALLREA